MLLLVTFLIIAMTMATTAMVIAIISACTVRRSITPGRPLKRSYHGVFCDGGDTYRAVRKLFMYTRPIAFYASAALLRVREHYETFGRPKIINEV